jgi:hypothetical protein
MLVKIAVSGCDVNPPTGFAGFFPDQKVHRRLKVVDAGRKFLKMSAVLYQTAWRHVSALFRMANGRQEQTLSSCVVKPFELPQIMELLEWELAWHGKHLFDDTRVLRTPLRCGA